MLVNLNESRSLYIAVRHSFELASYRASLYVLGSKGVRSTFASIVQNSAYYDSGKRVVFPFVERSERLRPCCSGVGLGVGSGVGSDVGRGVGSGVGSGVRPGVGPGVRSSTVLGARSVRTIFGC
jgi:hypothetical protein